MPGNEAGPPPTTASYVDSADCVICHEDKNTTWAATKHATAFPDLINSGHAADYCEPCHTVGAGVPDIFPATGYNTTTDTPTYLQNVSCQACHGPGSEHVAAPIAQKQATIGLVMNASLCGSCHYSTEGLSGSHHPTFNEWEYSGHNSSDLPSFVKQASCSNCHEAWNAMEYLETGVEKVTLRDADEDAPITWALTCPTCHDPHSTGAAGTQLRLPAEEICAKCHTHEGAVPGEEPHHPQAEMRNNTAGYLEDRAGPDYMSSVACSNCHMGDNLAGLPNHTFRPDPRACFVCHNDTGILPNLTSVEMAEDYIEAIEAVTVLGMEEATPLVEDADALLVQMRGNRTAEDLDAWTDEFEIALFNLQTVESDKSEGNHNPYLTGALLDDAIMRSEALIANLTPPAKIAGVEANDEGDGTLRVNWTVSTADDFAMYRIYALSSSKSNITSDQWEVEVTEIATDTYVLEGLDPGTYYVYVTAVDEDGNEITNTLSGVSVTLAEEGGGISTTTLAIIGGVIALVIVAALLLMRRKRGAKPEETPKE